MILVKRLLGVVLTLSTFSAAAENSPLWMRHPSISPDGNSIAFSYMGDIYTVSTQGGEARAITTHPSYDAKPIWSSDSELLAFESDRLGGKDVYVVSKKGGAAKRLTTHAAIETPVAFTPDNKSILFTANIMPDKAYGEFPNKMQLYAVPITGGRAKQILSHNAHSISFNSAGDVIYYHDYKGYEDEWRKHHKSSVCRDIWSYNLKSKAYQNITKKQVEDRDPRVSADDKSLYFLSERFGTFNVCKMGIDGSRVESVTDHKTHPVRFLSIADDNTLCYLYDGEIYTLTEGGESKKIDISIVRDQVEPESVREFLRSGAKDMAISPSGKEIAFVARGNVFVASTEHGTTKAITSTFEQERNIQFSPDGRELIYAAERDGQWHIYKSALTDKDDKLFVYADKIKETKLTDGMEAHFQPVFSPDGKKIAFLKNRIEFMVMDSDGKNPTLILEGKYNYSYTDGDQTFQWSPDSKWLLVRYFEKGGWSKDDIALVKADGSKQIINLTNSGYNDFNPTFAMGGKVVIWTSDKMGYRSHGSWGSQNDIYGMFLTEDGWDKFNMNKEELSLLASGKKDKAKSETKKDSAKPKDVKALKYDFDNMDRRVKRFTPISGSIFSSLMTNDGKKLFYIASYAGSADLYMKSFEDGSSKVVSKGIGGGALQLNRAGDKIYLLNGSGVKEISLTGSIVKHYGFNGIMDFSPQKEREYIFSHAWQQVVDKFYEPDIHGVDWAAFKVSYEKFLPHINNKYDFVDLLSELLGELNGSHTGARFGGRGSMKPTMSLGAFFDNTYNGNGLKIAEILPNGPLSVSTSKIEIGNVITHINGCEIIAEEDYYPMLSGLTSKKVLLTIKKGERGRYWEESVKPISGATLKAMLYKRWVNQRKEMVEKLSNGRLGYIHIEGMNSNSFRELYSELLGKYRNKEAIVIDTRSNGGGWLHEDILALLSGKKYAEFAPRGEFISDDPLFRWTKPSTVIMSENNYSNAHGFPWAYKELGVGKLIGTAVPGTMTAVWWEAQIDPSIVFGIPQIGIRDTKGRYIENLQLEPDVEVHNSPSKSNVGVDEQLERAVEELLKEL